MGQQQGGNQYRADDSLRAIQGEISGDANEGQQSCDHALDRQLEQLDRALDDLGGLSAVGSGASWRRYA